MRAISFALTLLAASAIVAFGLAIGSANLWPAPPPDQPPRSER